MKQIKSVETETDRYFFSVGFVCEFGGKRKERFEKKEKKKRNE